MGIGSVRAPEDTAARQSRMAMQGAGARQSRTAVQAAGTRQSRTAAQNTTAGQGTGAGEPDVVSKNIQDEISEVQRQKQGLSSKQEMSAEERSKAKQELQQELSSLNARLRQRQAEISREQKKEARLEELSAADADWQKSGAQAEDAGRTAAEKTAVEGTASGSRIGEKQETEKSTDAKGTEEKANESGAPQRKTGAGREEEPSDFDIPQDKKQSIVAGSISKEQMNRREAVIARMEGGIVILKGEIRQDEMRGDDTEKKKAELKAREAKVKNAVKDLPVVNLPSRKADKDWKNAGRVNAGQRRPEADNGSLTGIVKRSPDGVVVIT